jgi:hypothetical protein
MNELALFHSITSTIVIMTAAGPQRILDLADAWINLIRLMLRR